MNQKIVDIVKKLLHPLSESRISSLKSLYTKIKLKIIPASLLREIPEFNVYILMWLNWAQPRLSTSDIHEALHLYLLLCKGEENLVATSNHTNGEGKTDDDNHLVSDQCPIESILPNFSSVPVDRNTPLTGVIYCSRNALSDESTSSAIGNVDYFPLLSKIYGASKYFSDMKKFDRRFDPLIESIIGELSRIEKESNNLDSLSNEGRTLLKRISEELPMKTYTVCRTCNSSLLPNYNASGIPAKRLETTSDDLFNILSEYYAFTKFELKELTKNPNDYIQSDSIFTITSRSCRVLEIGFRILLDLSIKKAEECIPLSNDKSHPCQPNDSFQVIEKREVYPKIEANTLIVLFQSVQTAIDCMIGIITFSRNIRSSSFSCIKKEPRPEWMEAVESAIFCSLISVLREIVCSDCRCLDDILVSKILGVLFVLSSANWKPPFTASTDAVILPETSSDEYA